MKKKFFERVILAVAIGAILGVIAKPHMAKASTAAMIATMAAVNASIATNNMIMMEEARKKAEAEEKARIEAEAKAERHHAEWIDNIR